MVVALNTKRPHSYPTRGTVAATRARAPRPCESLRHRDLENGPNAPLGRDRRPFHARRPTDFGARTVASSAAPPAQLVRC